MKPTLLLAALLVPSLAVAGEPRELSSAVDSKEFQALFDKQLKRKYAPVDLTACYVQPGTIHFGAIWEKREQGNIQVRFGLTRNAMKAAITDFGNKAYRLEHLTGTGTGGPEMYGAVWSKIPGQDVVVRYGFPEKALLEEHKKQTEKKFVVHRVMAVEIDNRIHFTAAWDNDGIGQRDLEIGMSASRFKRDLRRRAKDGFRLRQVFAYIDRRSVKYACIWEKSDGPPQEVRIGMNAAKLKKTHDELTAKGFRPMQIQCYGVNRRDRFVGVWEQAK